MMDPLPCPFCGADPVIHEHRIEDEGYTACECPDFGRTHIAGVHADSAEEAVAGWNKRAAPAAERGEQINAKFDAKKDTAPDPALLKLLDLGEGPATVLKDSGGIHSPWWLVLPNGAAISFNHHADDKVDELRAKFVCDAINKALGFERRGGNS